MQTEKMNVPGSRLKKSPCTRYRDIGVFSVYRLRVPGNNPIYRRTRTPREFYYIARGNKSIKH